MPHFRKKPVEIEAVQLPPVSSVPAWLADAMDAGAVVLHGDGTANVDTPEGTMSGKPGDWIIRGVEGELYFCKPSIFAVTYEPV